MKKITLLFTLIMVFLFSTNEIEAQTTITIGTGTSSSSSRGPIHASNSASTRASRFNLIYTQAELTAEGITAGDLISELKFYKNTTSVLSGAGDAPFKIYIKNSSATGASTDQWNNLITGSSLVFDDVFSSTGTNFPATKDWMSFTFSSAFTYTGGALEVAVDWDFISVASPEISATDNALKFRYTDTSPAIHVARKLSSSALSNTTTLDAAASNTQYRPNIQFVYTLGNVAPWSEFSHAADLVVGQATLNDDVDQCTQNGLDGNAGIAIDFTNGKMYVVDEDNHRVLRFAYPPAGNQPNAEIVFGQPDFTTNTEPTSGTASAINLRSPSGVAVDASGNLYVGDDTHKRVLRYNSAHTIMTNQPAADAALGQTSLTSSGGDITANRSGSIQGIHIGSSGSLWVADDGYHRVMRFDNPDTKSTGDAADAVLGRADFTTGSTTAAATSASTFKGPVGVFEDMNGTLWVADHDNFRVLRFDNAINKANGASADGVLGQTDFVTGTKAGTQGAATFDEPMDVAVDNSGRLYVIDRQNDRLTTFDDAANKANGADADAVIGQVSFSNTGDGVSATRLNGGERSSIAIDNTNNYLWVSDSDNARVIRFSAASPLPVEMTYFIGNATAEGNLLEWETASEEINKGFDVQKSADGENWTTIGFVEGNGTSFEVNTYSYLDREVKLNTNYYRLKQMDFDGVFDYSRVITISSETRTKTSIRTYPNPVTNQLTIENFQGIVTVYNLLGQPLRMFTVNNQMESLPLSDLELGIYVLEMRGNDGSTTVKQIIKAAK